jgi:polyhydroxybutyrate depolymerase
MAGTRRKSWQARGRLVLVAVAVASVGIGLTVGWLSRSPNDSSRPPTCAAALGSGDSEHPVRALERQRAILVHVGEAAPSGALAQAVIALHGLGGTPAGLAGDLDLSDRADRDGFVVAYPEGVFGAWNYPGLAAPRDGEIGDLAMISALLTMLERSGCVDMERVYITGYSQGGGMAGYAACRFADRIRAVAIVAGEFFEPPCAPPRRIPVVAFHAVNDPVVAYAGGPIEGGDIEHPSTIGVEDYMRGWALQNGCTLEPTRTGKRNEPIKLVWQFCEQPVVLYASPFGGHTWPGAPYTGTSGGVNAVDVMWQFFAESRPALSLR